MGRLTNFYYSQYSIISEHEGVLFDSDNSEARASLADTLYYQSLKERKYLQCLHNNWKETISIHKNLACIIEEKCGMTVFLSDCYVMYKYKYIPEINGVLDEAFEYKITVRYSNISNMWHISPGYSHLPAVIDLCDWLQSRRNPIGSRVIRIIKKIKDLIDIFLKRLHYVENFMEYVHKAYKDIKIRVNESYTELKLLLSERGWPLNIEKTSPFDSIIISMTIDDHCEISELSYEHRHRKDGPGQLTERCDKEVEHRAHAFLNLSLEAAFRAFVEGY